MEWYTIYTDLKVDNLQYFYYYHFIYDLLFSCKISNATCIWHSLIWQLIVFQRLHRKGDKILKYQISLLDLHKNFEFDWLIGWAQDSCQAPKLIPGHPLA